MGGPASVDLLGANCAPPNTESTVLVYPQVHVCRAALSPSIIGLCHLVVLVNGIAGPLFSKVYTCPHSLVKAHRGILSRFVVTKT